ncbi:MAG: molybdopterin biosynthesis protein [Chloroflexota bacterium]
MSIYLRDIPLPEAQARLKDALQAAGRWGLLGAETILLDEQAAGRVLAEAVWAKISSPHYHASAMDGFAVRSADTAGAMPNDAVTLACGAGQGAAKYVDTGDPLPEWADAVIPIENVEPLDAHGQPAPEPRRPYGIRLRAAVTPWSHVRSMGEDMVATQLVLPAGHVLRPVDLGAMAACGHSQAVVARRPRVAILPTGSELIPVGQPARSGEIIEFNSLVLAAQVRQWGGEAVRFSITVDDFAAIRERVAQAALEYDLILLNAGSSAGSEDFSAGVVEALGQLLVHGVAVRPGHPVILGMIERGAAARAVDQSGHPGDSTQIPIIGVPGYPVSAALTGEIFVEPLLARWLGREPSAPEEVTATLTRKTTSPPGDDDYLRVAVGRVGDKLLAAPLARGSGVITSLVRADGIAILPRGSQGLPAGAPVRVRLYRSTAELERTIFAIGSHDVSLDLLAQFLARRGRRLASANVGSLGGLVALHRGEAHLAGSHLLDPETGEYNLSYIRQYLAGVAVKVVALVGRQQGLLVQKGNPLKIRSLEDLARSQVRFVNRQRGAGTRVLLDYHLERLGIASAAIQGYNQEEYTHLAVAAAVSSGRADAGLGIAAAAQALDLDFLPLYQEHYELVIPAEFYGAALLAPVLELLKDAAFQAAVMALPGYDVSDMGRLVAEVNG